MSLIYFVLLLFVLVIKCYKYGHCYCYCYCVLQVTVSTNDDYLLGGAHDVDLGWIKEVRKHGAKIVPRVLFDR